LKRATLVIAMGTLLLVLPANSLAKVGLHGRAKYVMTYDSYLVQGNTKVPPKTR
jgi:hypothetical protein